MSLELRPSWEALSWLNSKTGIAHLEEFIHRTAEYRTAAGLRANSKIDIGNAAAYDSEFGKKSIQALAGQLALERFDVVTAVPDGANHYMEAAAELAGVPSVTFKKLPDGGSEVVDQRDDGLKALRGKGKKAVIEDVTSTRHSMIDFIGQYFIRNAYGFGIVDRGMDLPGVTTLEQAIRCNQNYPELPPVHIAAGFPCYTLVHHPLELWLPPPVGA